MQEEGAGMKKELLHKKEAALEHLENFPSMHFTKKKKKIKVFYRKNRGYGYTTFDNKTTRD